MTTHLTRATSSAGNQKTFTFSAWVRLGKIIEAGHIFGSDVDDDSANYCHLSIEGDGTLKFLALNSSSIIANIVTGAKYYDTTAWYHIVLRADTTQSTAADRIRIYVNGSQVTYFTTNTIPSQNDDLGLFKSGNATLVGARITTGTSNFWRGEMAHVHLADGQSYAPSTFGETDSTSGIWKPKTAPSVTYGTNGAFLKFENSGSMGTDSSGNGNNFTVSGNVLQSVSTPSNKFPALNLRATHYDYEGPNYQPNGGHTFWGTTGTTRTCLIDMCFGAGKWYAEYKIEEADAENYIGVVLTDSRTPQKTMKHEGDLAQMSTSSGSSAAMSFKASGTSLVYQGNTSSSYGTGIVDNDIIMIAFDCATGKMWAGRNGTWFNAPGTSNAGDPAAGTYDSGKTITNTDRELYTFYVGGTSSGGTNRYSHINFGHGYFGTTAVASANSDANGFGVFEYAVPSGFYAVCSKNIQDYGG